MRQIVYRELPEKISGVASSRQIPLQIVGLLRATAEKKRKNGCCTQPPYEMRTIRRSPLQFPISFFFFHHGVIDSLIENTIHQTHIPNSFLVENKAL
jgi:hypothetical protein